MCQPCLCFEETVKRLDPTLTVNSHGSRAASFAVGSMKTLLVALRFGEEISLVMADKGMDKIPAMAQNSHSITLNFTTWKKSPKYCIMMIWNPRMIHIMYRKVLSRKIPWNTLSSSETFLELKALTIWHRIKVLKIKELTSFTRAF
jgi:hypothetical protein